MCDILQSFGKETKELVHGIRIRMISLIGRHPIRQFNDGGMFVICIGSFSVLKLQYPIIFSPFWKKFKF